MSVVAREQERITPAEGAAAQTRVIRWTVSARALGAVRPDVVGADCDREDATLDARIEIAESRFHGTVVAMHAGRVTEVQEIGGAVQHSTIAGHALVHLDSDDLVATLRVRGEEHETLYARLPLLARLGIAGGRYELRPSF